MACTRPMPSLLGPAANPATQRAPSRVIGCIGPGTLVTTAFDMSIRSLGGSFIIARIASPISMPGIAAVVLDRVCASTALLYSLTARIAAPTASTRSTGSAMSVCAATKANENWLPPEPFCASVRTEIGTETTSDCSGSSSLSVR